MAWRHLLLAITVPALIFAENSIITSAETSALTDADNTTTLESQPRPAESPNLCNTTQIEHVYNISKEETKCLKKFLLLQVNDGNETSCNTFESVNKSIATVLNDYAKCFGKKRRPMLIAARKSFLNVLNFSMESDKLKEIVQEAFVDCINKTKHNTRKCVLSETGVKKYNPMLRLLQLRRLELSEHGCSQSRRIRSCVKTALKGEAACNNTAIVNYVDSLFNFTSQHCTQPTSLQNTVSAKMHPGVIAAIVILAIVITLIVGAVIKKRVKRRASLNSVIYNSPKAYNTQEKKVPSNELISD